jgi:hypothetical protein
MANLSKAIKDLRTERERLAGKLEKLDKAIAVLGKLDTARGVGGAVTGRRRLSAAARNRIARAQKLRWAKWKAKQQQKAS